MRVLERRWNLRARLLSFVVIGCGLPACGPQPAAERGQELAGDPRFSPSPSNLFACTTCHATAESDKSGRLLPGHTLVGAASRPTYWNGGLSYLLDAVNQCLVDFMRGEKLAPENPDGRALLAFLRSIDAAPSAALPCTVVPNIDATYLGSLPPGDAGRGAGLYVAACRPCHGEPHTGKDRIGARASIIPEDTINSFGSQARAVTAEKVRHGRYFGISGSMPFYCQELLSDGNLSDLLAYLFP